MAASKVDSFSHGAAESLRGEILIKTFRKEDERPISFMSCHVQPLFLEESVRAFSTFFLKPRLPAHRQYEALRAFYVDRLPAKTVAPRFGYTVSAFNSLRRDFARRHRATKYFRDVVRRPWSKRASKKSQWRGVIVELRKRYWSIYDIAHELQRRGQSLDPSAIFRILRSEGFAKLPRRLEIERRGSAGPCRHRRAESSLGSTASRRAAAPDAETPRSGETLARSATASKSKP